MDTASKLAAEHKVNERTIKRDAAFARAVDTIADVAGPEARQTILSRDTKVTQHEVKTLATIAKANPQTATHVLDAVQEAKTLQEAKQIVQEAAKAQEHVGSLAMSEAFAGSGVEPALPADLPPNPKC